MAGRDLFDVVRGDVMEATLENARARLIEYAKTQSVGDHYEGWVPLVLVERWLGIGMKGGVK